MNKLLILLLVFTVSCGKKRHGVSDGGGSSANPSQPAPVGTLSDQYVSVQQAVICLSTDTSCNSEEDEDLVSEHKPKRHKHRKNFKKLLLEFMNPMQLAIAATTSLSIVTYTATNSGSILLGPLTTSTSTGFEIAPSFGTVGVTAFDSNDLKKCGISGTARCSVAVVRAYVSSRSPNFVEDGAKVMIGGVVLSDIDGVGEAVTLISGSIGSNQNRIRNSPIGQNPFGGAETDLGELVLDLSNANLGSYSVTVVLELAIGPLP